MTPQKKDPTVRILTDLERSAATVAKCEGQLAAARARHRSLVMGAVAAGVSKAELARRLRTSESQIRKLTNRARVEA